MLYFIGAIMANIGILPSKGPESESLLKMQDLFTNVTIPLAIPLMLFCFTYKKSETRDQLLAMITGLAAVIIAVVAGYPIFGPHIPDGPRVAGMYTACLTGGTVNMAAVSKSLGSPDTQYALLNTYDMIVSNPPYVSAAQMEELDRSVRDYEPHLALYGGQDGLDFYRAIVKNYTPILKPGGYICFEFGMGQEADVCHILMEHGYELGRLARDSGERARAVLARKPDREEE